MLVCDRGFVLLSKVLNMGKFSILPPHWFFELNSDKCLKEDELSCDDWINVIKQIPFYSDITIGGSDPTKREDFCDILQFASKKTFSRVKLITNAKNLNQQIIDSIIDNKLKLLTVTMDKFPNQTVISNLSNLYKRCVERKANIAVEIQAKILKNNLEDLLKIYEYATNNGFEHFSVSFEKNNELQRNFNLSDTFGKKFYSENYPIEPYFDIEKLEKIYTELNKLKKYSKTKICFQPDFKDFESIKTFFNSKDKDAKEIYEPCNYPYINLTINPAGNIYPCLSYKMGHVKENSLKNILRSRNYRIFMRHLKIRKVFSSCTMCQELKVKE